ncbi:hypothetical protein ACIA5A_21380 [Micromonospora sp. NPDC051300]|uniref:hypothetical protein n=1 Tax=Micromonospora sp. NPDC051300 TaxID=3364286 RepID=UPI00378A6CD7
MIRTLAATSLASVLLLAGCSSADTPAAAPASPSVPSDREATGACLLVAGAIEKEDVLFGAGTRPAYRALRSTDPGIKEAGRELMAAGMAVEELLVKDAPDVDRGPATTRLVDAQLELLSACNDLFGPQPWPFDRSPAPTATR